MTVMIFLEVITKIQTYVVLVVIQKIQLYSEHKLNKEAEKPIKKLSFWSKLLGKKEIIRLPEFDMYGYYKCPKCNEFTMEFNLIALCD